jgi:hypothetical protein
MASVERWAVANGYDYRSMGDELFDTVPDWYMRKVRGRMPIAADLARLQWMQRFLRGDYDWVIWMDADMLVFAPDLLSLDLTRACTFGQEHWVQAKSGDQGRWEVRKNIHNAFAAFPADCPVLPFLVDIILRMMRRVDAVHIAPQMMGPKLLSNLHNLASFDYRADIGALSPEVLSTIAGGGFRDAGKNGNADRSALNALCLAQPRPLVAANLCASLLPRTLGMAQGESSSDEFMQRVIRLLLGCASGLSQSTDLDA